ncbi:DUF4047 domain-containing protein [Bacillus arachidis]|uniref:DUF4047 domain-containing protein n=1 Tax=Bacillus arachidis TaxID=2819290 RepID=UPI00255C3456|nr:DUF4047 domain-containing protein [Bacillus arachidis]WIY62460.1 DUF4047 domain-containing protein [Bacillus arachidis]
MLKSSKKLKTMLMFPCMCSIVFYMGSQVVTYTEAAFVNETKIHSTVSTAIVFPKTIDTLVKKAEQHESLILKVDEGMNKEIHADSIEILEPKVKELREQLEQVKVERETLQHIYAEIEDYYNQSIENVKVNNSDSSKEVLQYVQVGFTKVKSMKDNVDKKISVPKIEEFILTLQKRIEDEKVKQVSNTPEKVEQEQVIPPSEQKELKKQEEIKQPLKPKQEQINQIEQTEETNRVLQQPEEKKEEVPQQDSDTVHENH